jgi:lipopolysaccharide transport system ATP-binding protein
MKDVSGQGRTVLFVSHNMAAINTLCTQAILLKNGRITHSGNTDDVVSEYLKINSEHIQQYIHFENVESALGNDLIKIKSIAVTPDEIDLEDEINLSFEFWSFIEEQKISLCYDLINIQDQTVFSAANEINVQYGEISKTRCIIPGNFLNNSIYTINVWFLIEGTKLIYHKRDAVQFEVIEKARDSAYFGKVNGVVRPILNWES